jgi:hypothetical protein
VTQGNAVCVETNFDSSDSSKIKIFKKPAIQVEFVKAQVIFSFEKY